ncbi:MAG: signal recognition particle-docking protein FtsY [Ignavibacteriales bacterium]|nr:signal recognition particle-docking protein FtsY [Ignavibacteriales bacterium]
MANIFKNLISNAFKKTRENISTAIKSVFNSTNINLDDLEEILLKSDFGYEFTEQILDEIKKNKSINETNLIELLRNNLKDKLAFIHSNDKHLIVEKGRLLIIQIIGVNGSGKTTSIGKLANYYKNQGLKVLIASCDTFRAAANEQLSTWASKAEIRIIEDFSKDPAAVAFEAIKIAKEEKFDILFIDTAGRLHTNKNLMLELQKIDAISSKFMDNNSSKESWLIVDGNSGQNAITQFNEFSKYVKITGIVITKLDGTSKGGTVFQIAFKNNIPIRFLGVGEGLENISEFDVVDYVNSLLGK